VERAMGIEPTAQAWEAWVLPLYDARRPRIIAELARGPVKRSLKFCHKGKAPCEVTPSSWTV
jgi:hypothetical protein